MRIHVGHAAAFVRGPSVRPSHQTKLGKQNLGQACHAQRCKGIDEEHVLALLQSRGSKRQGELHTLLDSAPDRTSAHSHERNGIRAGGNTCLAYRLERPNSSVKPYARHTSTCTRQLALFGEGRARREAHLRFTGTGAAADLGDLLLANATPQQLVYPANERCSRPIWGAPLAAGPGVPHVCKLRLDTARSKMWAESAHVPVQASAPLDQRADARAGWHGAHSSTPVLCNRTFSATVRKMSTPDVNCGAVMVQLLLVRALVAAVQTRSWVITDCRHWTTGANSQQERTYSLQICIQQMS